MNFLCALGWVFFAFLLGFLLGIGFAGYAHKKSEDEQTDRKVAEK